MKDLYLGGKPEVYFLEPSNQMQNNPTSLL